MSPELESRMMTARLRQVFRRSSAEDRAAGIAWYGRAQDAAAEIAAESGVSVRQAAGVIAAMSPRVRWSTNVQAARSLAQHFSGGGTVDDAPRVGLGGNVAKACRILAGEDPDDVLRGPKVTAFFANITGDHDRVTVDVWAARAAEGFSNPLAPSGGRYNRLADAYRAAAKAFKMTPRDFQAAVWVHERGAAA